MREFRSLAADSLSSMVGGREGKQWHSLRERLVGSQVSGRLGCAGGGVEEGTLETSSSSTPLP